MDKILLFRNIYDIVISVIITNIKMSYIQSGGI